MKLIRKMFKNEEGATAIEYGLIAALIAVAAIAAMQSIGTNLGTTFNSVADNLAGEEAAAAPAAEGA
jgi:pilus assembly protein Flp/PilA